jgi:diguanylate cyclase (GGDEF)-like protein
MPVPGPKVYLLGTADSTLAARVEAVLARAGAQLEIATSAQGTLAILKQGDPPDVVLLHETLPGLETEQLLDRFRANSGGLPVVLITDHATEQLPGDLAAGGFDDIVPRNCEADYWRLRAERAIRVRNLERELNETREAAARNGVFDRLTGVLNRDAVLSALFRETDRVQRMRGSLAVILFDVDDFGHWNSQLGGSVCDEILREIAARIVRLLRTYDLVGRVGKDEFLVGLPGCGVNDAAALAERFRREVFAEPYRLGGHVVRLSACFGVAQSFGRSPVVVLREAEQALGIAREIGPETIQFGVSMKPDESPVTHFSTVSGDELLAR